jgi:C1A family cysteine protease
MNLPLSSGGRRYNLRPNLPDHRDYGLSRVALVAPADLPSEISLDAWLGPVRDQKDEGSCTGQAAAGDNDFQLRKYDPRFKADASSAPVVSAQFIYRMSRKMAGTEGEDSGSDGRTTCKVLHQFGACTEESWPYVAGDIYADPSEAQLLEAKKYKSGAYHFLYTVEDMKRCLASSYCFRLGMAVYESFESDTGRTAVYAPDPSAETLLGYHEILGKGYSDYHLGGAFSIRNSWGADWAEKGDFWMPFDVMADRKIFADAVIQHRGKAW